MSAKGTCMMMAKRCNLTVCAAKAQGGRPSRSRVFENPVAADQDYYGPASALFHAINWQEMESWLRGYDSHMRKTGYRK